MSHCSHWDMQVDTPFIEVKHIGELKVPTCSSKSLRHSYLRKDRVMRDVDDLQSWVHFPLARSQGNPGTVTIPQYRFNKTKQHTQQMPRYQSHSVTLTWVERDSYQSRLGLTTLQSTEKYLRVYSLGVSPACIRNEPWVQIKGAVDVNIKCRRALHEAGHKSLKHADNDCEWDRFWFI